MIMIKRYVKRPVEVSALLYRGAQDAEALEGFVVGRDLVKDIETGQRGIRTLEGIHQITDGDYIIRGVAGEFYPCKPDIFAATYEEAPSRKQA